MSKPECIMEVDEGEWRCIVLHEGAWEEKLHVDINEKWIPGGVIIEEIRTCLVCGDQDISYPL